MASRAAILLDEAERAYVVAVLERWLRAQA